MGINVPIPGKFMPAALMRLELLSVATCQRKGPLKITTFCPSFQGVGSEGVQISQPFLNLSE